ncbi:MAG: BrnT family toxin [Bifidobacteriaceae bacterium]|nr:BrnT family toxin [Bifidobacteriaceae bacterium]
MGRSSRIVAARRRDHLRVRSAKKGQANRAKHGIDFERAKLLWRDRLGFDLAAGHPSEPRFSRLARLEGRIYAAFRMPRGEVVRLISVRRATQREARLYNERNRR